MTLAYWFLIQLSVLHDYTSDRGRVSDMYRMLLRHDVITTWNRLELDFKVFMLLWTGPVLSAVEVQKETMDLWDNVYVQYEKNWLNNSHHH